jgi:rubredoxin
MKGLKISHKEEDLVYWSYEGLNGLSRVVYVGLSLKDCRATSAHFLNGVLPTNPAEIIGAVDDWLSIPNDAYCPECCEKPDHKGRAKRVQLDITEFNYHGIGIDLAECPECGEVFQISYKIDEIERF